MPVIRITNRIAKKKHLCNACLFLFESDYRSLGATISEYRQIISAKRENGYIRPGEAYQEVVTTDEGMFTFRQKPAIDEICRKYDLYPD